MFKVNPSPVHRVYEFAELIMQDCKTFKGPRNTNHLQRENDQNLCGNQ